MRFVIAGVSAALILPATAAVAHAEPAVPQPNTPCAAGAEGALTQAPDLTNVLVCTDGRWQRFDDPYPAGDRWLTYGPAMTLHGEAQRNREIDSGGWVGDPQEPDAVCAATQIAIEDTGSLGPPRTATGEPGWPLELNLRPLLFTVELSGYCLWRRGNLGPD